MMSMKALNEMASNQKFQSRVVLPIEVNVNLLNLKFRKVVRIYAGVIEKF